MFYCTGGKHKAHWPDPALPLVLSCPAPCLCPVAALSSHWTVRSSYMYTVLKLRSALWRQRRGWCGLLWKWVWYPCFTVKFKRWLLPFWCSLPLPFEWICHSLVTNHPWFGNRRASYSHSTTLLQEKHNSSERLSHCPDIVNIKWLDVPAKLLFVHRDNQQWLQL